MTFDPSGIVCSTRSDHASNASAGLFGLAVYVNVSLVAPPPAQLSHTAVTDFAESLQKSGFFKMPVEIVTTLMETVDETTVIRFVLKAEPVMGVGLPVAPVAPAAAGRPGA